MNMQQVHQQLEAYRIRRFKCWHNQDTLAHVNELRRRVRRDFHMYLMLWEDLEAAGAACRKNGHVGNTALMSFCNAVIDHAKPHPQHVQIMNSIKWFIEHTEKHNCTPIWGEMNAIARDYLTRTLWPDYKEKEHESEATDAG